MCEYLFCYFFTPSMQCLSFACSIVVYSRKTHESSKKLAEHALHFARMHNLVPRALFPGQGKAPWGGGCKMQFRTQNLTVFLVQWAQL